MRGKTLLLIGILVRDKRFRISKGCKRVLSQFVTTDEDYSVQKRIEAMLTVEVCQRHDEADVEENREGEESNDAYPKHVILNKHAPHPKKDFPNRWFIKPRIRVWLRRNKIARYQYK